MRAGLLRAPGQGGTSGSQTVQQGPLGENRNCSKAPTWPGASGRGRGSTGVLEFDLSCSSLPWVV